MGDTRVDTTRLVLVLREDQQCMAIDTGDHAGGTLRAPCYYLADLGDAVNVRQSFVRTLATVLM